MHGRFGRAAMAVACLFSVQACGAEQEADPLAEEAKASSAGTSAGRGSKWLTRDPDNRTPADAFAMRCVPETVGPDDILEVTFLQPAASEALIMGPDGSYFFLSSSLPAILEGPPLSSVYMQSTDRIRIPIWAAKAQGKGGLEPVFVKPGTYRLIVGPILDGPIEEFHISGYCHFNYVPTKRGKRESFDLKANGWTGL